MNSKKSSNKVEKISTSEYAEYHRLYWSMLHNIFTEHCNQLKAEGKEISGWNLALLRKATAQQMRHYYPDKWEAYRECAACACACVAQVCFGDVSDNLLDTDVVKCAKYCPIDWKQVSTDTNGEIDHAICCTDLRDSPYRKLVLSNNSNNQVLVESLLEQIENLPWKSVIVSNGTKA